MIKTRPTLHNNILESEKQDANFKKIRHKTKRLKNTLASYVYIMIYRGIEYVIIDIHSL